MTIKEFFKSKDKLAIHCDTEAKAMKLLKAFDKAGYRWAAGDSYIEGTNWDVYRKKTCYSNDGYFGNAGYFIKYSKDHYTIIEFDEIELEDSSLKSCVEKIQSIIDKEEKGPQSMKEAKKAIEKTLQKCAEFFGITNCGNSVCTYTYEYSDNKITIYTDRPGYWIGYHGNGVTILKAAFSAALHRDNVEVAFIELKGSINGSIQIGE